MATQQFAFLSYTRIDDEYFRGAITSLRKFLELGVKVATGNRDFNIFQDVDGIEFGQRWQKLLDAAISDSKFLIPIVTPLFFHSEACRDELEKFLEHEKSLGRDDLILPIYFVTAPVLEKPELLKEDPLASEISARQRYDWRPRANLPIDDPDVRAAVMELSNKIAAAIARTEPSITATSGVKRERDAAFKEASEAVKRQEPQRTERRDQKRILWVDDRPNNNVVERKAMEAYNIEFTLALSTGDALAKLRGNRFDAIISDMSRPQDARAGYTLLQALRESGDNTPYFIYAGPRSSDPKSVREAKDRGAQGSTDRPSELIDGVLRSVGVAS